MWIVEWDKVLVVLMAGPNCGISLDEIRAVRSLGSLADRIGAKKLKELAEALA